MTVGSRCDTCTSNNNNTAVSKSIISRYQDRQVSNRILAYSIHVRILYSTAYTGTHRCRKSPLFQLQLHVHSAPANHSTIQLPDNLLTTTEQQYRKLYLSCLKAEILLQISLSLSLSLFLSVSVSHTQTS